MVAIDLLRDVLSRTGRTPSLRDLSRAMIRVLRDPVAGPALMEQAVEVIDGYLTQASDDSIFAEPAFTGGFNSDLNGFLKWEQVGKSEEHTPRLRNALAMAKGMMGRSLPGMESPRALLQRLAA